MFHKRHCFTLFSEMKHSITKVDSNEISSPRSVEDTNGVLTSQEDKRHTDLFNADMDSKNEDVSEDSFDKTADADRSEAISHSIGSEMEKDDWSDWENDDLESQISEEIERELESMHVTESLVDEKKKSEDNFNQKRTSVKEPQKSSVHSKHGAMKLEKKVKLVTSENENEIDKVDAINVSSTTKVAKLSSPKQTISQTHSKNKPISSNPNAVLGAEFDIKSVNIKVDPAKKTDPFDFFADMAPSISHSKPVTDTDSMENDRSKTVTSEEKDGAKTVSFDMVQITEEEVSL